MKKLVMFYGYPLTGKSTASEKIRKLLLNEGIAVEVVSSSKLRLHSKNHSSSKGFINEENKRTKKVKDEAYISVCRKAEICLKKGIVPILDATFHKYIRRKWVYDLAKKQKADVYLLWMEFDDEKNIRKYLSEREDAKKRDKLHTWEQYITMVSQTEKIRDEEIKSINPVVKVIRFNRGEKKAKFLGKKDDFGKKLVQAISK
jgi:predicted kinase